MGSFFFRVMRFLRPPADVPEAEERHVRASQLRQEKIEELRLRLRPNLEIERKINGVTQKLVEALK